MLHTSLILFLEDIPRPLAGAILLFWFIVLSFLNAFYIYEYHLKFTKYIVQRFGMNNTFIQALILCFLNGISKIVFLGTLYNPFSIGEFASSISGSTQLSMAVTLALVLLSTKTNCFVHHTSFYKDIIFLEAAHLLLLLLLLDAPHFFTIPFMALAIFLVFLFNTVLLPVYIAPPVVTDTVSTSSTTPNPMLSSILYPIKYIFDAVLFDPPSPMSQGDSKKTSYTNIFSPIINLLTAVVYFRIGLKHSELIALSICALILGGILYMLAVEKVLIELLYLYSFMVSLLFFSMITGSFISLTEHISKLTGLGTQFLSGTLLAFQANLAEIVVCCDYAKGGAATLAICSILYTHIYSSLFAFPALKIFSAKDGRHFHNLQGVPFMHFSYVFTLAEIKVIFINYALRHHKLTKDLAYTLLVIYFLFMVGFSMEGKPHLCK